MQLRTEFAKTRFAASIFAVILCVYSCRDPAPNRFFATCSVSTECEGGLCLNQKCTRACKSANDCEGGLCIDGVCREIGSVACKSAAECKALIPLSACLSATCGDGFCIAAPASDGTACTDDPCDVGQVCASGTCKQGAFLAKNCSDGIGCTTDSCDAKTGCIHNVSPDSLCEDGLTCTADACDVTSGCVHDTQAGAKCDDGLVCTSDLCDPTDGCVHKALDKQKCDDASACTIGDTCGGSKCVGAPVVWSKTGSAADLNVAQALAIKGDKIYIAGTVKVMKDNLAQQYAISVLDLLGNIVSDHAYGELGDDAFYAITATTTGLVAVGLHLPNPNFSAPTIAYYDDLANELTRTSLTFKETAEFRGVVALGTGVRAAGHIDNGPFQRVVLVVDFAGDKAQTQVTKVIATAKEDVEARAIVAHPDGGTVIGGVAAAATGEPTQPWIGYVDAAGAVLWQKIHPDNGRVSQMVAVKDGFAMAGQYAKGAATGDMWLWRVDLAGNTLWSHNYAVAASSSAAGVVVMADHFQLLGFGRTNPTSSAAVWSARVDLQGNLVHALPWPQANESFGTGVVALPDGGYAFCGFHNAGGNVAAIVAGRQDRWGFFDCTAAMGCLGAQGDCASSDTCSAAYCDKGCKTLKLDDGSACGAGKFCSKGVCK